MFKNPKRITNCTNCGGKIPRRFPKIRNPNDFELKNNNHEQTKQPIFRYPEENILNVSESPQQNNKKKSIKQQRISLGFLPQPRK